MRGLHGSRTRASVGENRLDVAQAARALRVPDVTGASALAHLLFDIFVWASASQQSGDERFTRPVEAIADGRVAARIFLEYALPDVGNEKDLA